MTIATAVTAMAKSAEVTDTPAGGGRLVHGMFLEGAAWMHDVEECEVSSCWVSFLFFFFSPTTCIVCCNK